MLDFYEIKVKNGGTKKDPVLEVYPEFKVSRNEDLMIRGGSFYAVWNEEDNLWSRNEYDVAKIIDADLRGYANSSIRTIDEKVNVKTMMDFSSGSWVNFQRYMKNLPDNSHDLDNKIIYSNDIVTKKDYSSKKVGYPLENTSIESYEELMSTLYEPQERRKIEWVIGSILTGDSKRIQKFLVFYGEGGSGKSTVLNIIQDLFKGYWAPFNAKELASNNNSFALEAFKDDPLVAIQHDGDLSRIEDNTLLNSIVSHETMAVNEKYKSKYDMRFNAFLIMASNKPVKITDAKSGLIRRLIDVKPSGNKVPGDRYLYLIEQIKFELGGIAKKCISEYKRMGIHYYDGYKAIDMMEKTNVFFNFIEDNYFFFKEEVVTLKAAWTLYIEYCSENGEKYPMPRHRFKDELKNYYKDFRKEYHKDGMHYRNVYLLFDENKFKKDINNSNKESEGIEEINTIELKEQDSIFDLVAADYPAQLTNPDGYPKRKWENNTQKLSKINTKKLHYVKLPENHIVIDFDIKDEKGDKNLEANLREASKFPPTYAETSKSGCGIHLHYIYNGDVAELSNLYSEDIEIKKFSGNASLRRKLSLCNSLGISVLNSGLPLKKKGGDFKIDKFVNEKTIRTLIRKNLNKEYHANTAPSVDFIRKILDDAYLNGVSYDVRDMEKKIKEFAGTSTNQKERCLKQVSNMKFCSIDILERERQADKDNEILTFYDVEVMPNLFVVVYKDADCEPVKMINPTSADMSFLIKKNLIGHNCRRYDNHIIYARMLGFSNEDLYKLSQRIISGDRSAFFKQAYGISYTDTYDYPKKKQSLKKWEIELGVHHKELGLPWNKPVDKEKWELVADYCVNDVVATEVLFNATQGDFSARKILADISGLTVNDTTNSHTTRFIFGKNRNPKLNYVDLSETFKGYTFDPNFNRSDYRGEITGEGGYVYSEPGYYENVALLDIASMHPTSIIVMNALGEYTQKFKEIVEARLAIKHNDLEKAKKLLNGVLTKYLDGSVSLKDVSEALKIAINSVYGLTSAKFINPFKDARNIDNIVAKRGALFMIDLKHAVQEKGFTVAHIKTDSIKIPNATQEIIDFVMEFGKKYGYTFEHEATYKKMCLVNKSVYIAQNEDGSWTPTGKTFQVPYIYKSLFSKEQMNIEDYFITNEVQTSMYLDFNEGLKDDEHNYKFVGKVGCFVPVKEKCGGGILLRDGGGKYDSVAGSKGYRWIEAEYLKASDIGKLDMSYYDKIKADALEEIGEYIDPNIFIED